MAPKISWLAIAAILLLPQGVWSDTVEDLNTHVSGDTARAADVNENFTAVKTAVDGNDALIAALEARIAALEAQAPVPGPEGPPGEPGEDGIDGAPGADGSDAEVLHVFDVDGRDLGLLADTGDSNFWSVFVPDIGEVKVLIWSAGIYQHNVRFDTPDCMGQAYVRMEEAGSVVGNQVSGNPAIFRYFVGDIGEAELIVTPAYNEDALGRCELVPGEGFYGIPATEITAEDLGLPWPAPLYTDLAPEAGP